MDISFVVRLGALLHIELTARGGVSAAPSAGVLLRHSPADSADTRNGPGQETAGSRLMAERTPPSATRAEPEQDIGGAGPFGGGNDVLPAEAFIAETEDPEGMDEARGKDPFHEGIANILAYDVRKAEDAR